MKIYLDLILILNFVFDFLLLMGVSIFLRRNTSFYRLCLGAFIGSISTFSLFLKINSLQLFLIKVLISISMCLITYRYKNIKYTLKNLFYLYTTSMFLGGALYFLNNQFAYKNVGLVFYHNGLSINVIVLLLLAPIIVYFYARQIKELKNNYSNYYKVKIKVGNHIINCTGFLDTGNKLVDPYFKKPVIILDKRKIVFDINEFQMILVPLLTVSGTSTIKCFKADYIDIEGVGQKTNFLVGLIEDNIKIDGVDVILNYKLWEE